MVMAKPGTKACSTLNILNLKSALIKKTIHEIFTTVLIVCQLSTVNVLTSERFCCRKQYAAAKKLRGGSITLSTHLFVDMDS